MFSRSGNPLSATLPLILHIPRKAANRSLLNFYAQEELREIGAPSRSLRIEEARVAGKRPGRALDFSKTGDHFLPVEIGKQNDVVIARGPGFSQHVFMRWFSVLLLFFLGIAWSVAVQPDDSPQWVASASSTLEPSGVRGPFDGDRFSSGAKHAWKGGSSPHGVWTWQVQFPNPRVIGSILQIQGDHDFVFTNAPSRYRWLTSDDGHRWKELRETSVSEETRLYRIHRLKRHVRSRYLRLEISTIHGAFPTLREIEFFPETNEQISFPAWVLLVNSTDDPRLPNHGQEFLPLVRSCPGWDKAPAQQVWVGKLDPNFVATEPRPLCAFFSGSFKDWCEVDRETWRGTQKILRAARLPIWASCGGAQGLAILAETGVDHRWDCPHCRDPKNPQLPIYTHLGHTGRKMCGDYSACVFERGAHNVRLRNDDPVFRGLGSEFKVMESHCGQIEWPPPGWESVVGAGAGTQTVIQCLRRKGRPIYAAQFHIEMAGTPETSQTIMNNFLAVARSWRGAE